MMNQVQDEALNEAHSGIKDIKQIGLLDMPIELMDIILSNVQITKKMRLISKQFRENLTICRHAFTTFTLWPRVDCYEALDLIAHNPNLSTLVQRIQISNLPRLFRFTSVLKWAETRPDLNLMDPSTHDLWTKHCTWVEAENDFWEDGVIPRLDLRLLENLEAVEMVGLSHLLRETADGQILHRREEETQSLNLARSWHYGDSYYGNCHFASFARGSLSSLTTMKKLVVHMLQDLLSVSEGFELPEVECLDIHMESLALWNNNPEFDFSNYVAPAPWLLSLNNLTTLKLTQCALRMGQYNWDLCYPDVITLIKDIEFPSLREVRLRTITTTSDSLHQFLCCTNAKHIKVLSILRPAIHSRAWFNLRRTLEKMDPPYERLELSDAYLYDIKYAFEEDYLYDSDFRYAPSCRNRRGEY